MNIYMKEALNESKKALEINDIPVGAVVVINNTVIGRGFNKRFVSKEVTDHAEIIAIKEASLNIGDWRLNDCDLYVTLEPCPMCKSIIAESRIKNVYYLVKKSEQKKQFKGTSFQQLISEADYDVYFNELSSFFKTNGNR